MLKGSPNACKVCPIGKFGDESNYPDRNTASYCQNCPAGRYGSLTKSTDPQCSGECTAGYYCPSTELNTLPTGGSSAANPLLISAGYFGGTGSSTAEGSSECPAGYFCPEGTADIVCEYFSVNLDNCRSRCGYNTNKPEAYFCPARSSTRSVVSAGYYAAGIGDPDHEEETRDQEKGCKPPNYCPGGALGDGKEKPCEAGKFGNSEKLKTNECKTVVIAVVAINQSNFFNKTLFG